jgi:tetratricopeptide (TPR) repeat protein
MGDQARAIQSNERAVAADEAYMRANGVDDEQLMYYHHDLESLAVAAGASGRYATAHRAGTSAAGHVAKGPANPGHFSPILGFVLLRFGRWEEALRLPAPPTSAEPPDPLWHHFTRSVANAQLRRVPAATLERDSFHRVARGVPADAFYRQNPVARVIEVASAILDARLAAARGESDVAIQAWERAVAAQDRLVYHEPPPIYYSVRESLGAALHAAARLPQAEAVFREDLSRNPRSGRSLFGLWHTLLALGRRPEADATKRAFDEVWTGSDTTLSLADF